MGAVRIWRTEDSITADGARWLATVERDGNG
jgi:hypothetical protein